MSLADAVISLAGLVKQLSDDATDNVGLCKSLGGRIEMIPRLLEKFPHMQNIDEQLLTKVFQALKDSRDVITEYGKKGKMGRFFQSSSIKKKFNDLDALIGQCVDDLTLAIGISSSSKIDELGDLVTTINTLIAGPKCEDKVEGIEDIKAKYLLDYNDIEFSIKRGIRKEVHVSSSQFRLYLGKYNGEDAVIREPIFDINEGVTNKWKSTIESIGVFMTSIQEFPLCFANILGGGVEYLDKDDADTSPEVVQQLFVVMKYYPKASLFAFIQSSEWIKSDLERSLIYIYRIAVAAYLLHSHKAFVIDDVRPFISPDAILLTENMEPVVSLSHIFHLSNLTADKGTVMAVTYLENIPIKTLRWYTPEQVKSDQNTSGVNLESRDVYSLALLFCYMFTARLPYADVLQERNDEKSECDVNSAHLLLDNVRSLQQLPYNLSSLFDNSSLMELISLCLQHDPKKRPELLFFLTSINSICMELKVQLPFDMCDFNIPPHLPKGSCEDPDKDDSEDGLLDFDEMTTQVENVSSSVKVFAATPTDEEASLVVFGGKVVLTNFSLEERDKSGNKFDHFDDDEEEEGGEIGVSLEINVKNRSKLFNDAGTGIIIFHIDNTTSMKRQRRNEITKDVLQRVIPDLLRKSFRVIINSWASDATTLGRIQTRTICPPQDLLEPEMKDELAQYIRNTIFEILIPSGKTDLYGSVYQLLEQCEELVNDGKRGELAIPIYCIVLTDGNHNHFDYPAHKPKHVGEDYFGIYVAKLIKNQLKFALSGKSPDIPTAEAFLANKFKSTYEKVGKIYLTLIGIGEAGTAPLAKLASVMGDQCSFVGITEVNQADCVFNSIDSNGSNDQVRVVFTNGSDDNVSEDFQYVVGDEGSSRISGCFTITDASKIDWVVNRANAATVFHADLALSFVEKPFFNDDKSVVSEGSKYDKPSFSLEELLEAVLPLLTQVRSKSYEVTADTFQSIFGQLIRDKKNLWMVKTALYSKRTRHFRSNAVFVALTVWLRELEYLIESQISSYRVNVEDELFSEMERATVASSKSGTSFCVQPANMVLERLRNNLQNTGKKVHQVRRHVSAIRGIRDSTINLAMFLLSSDLRLMETTAGVVLSVLKKNGKQYSVTWSSDTSTGPHRIKELIQTIDIAQMGKVMPPFSQVTYPCYLLQASFDPLTVIRASELFFFQDICLNLSNQKPLQFCAEEIWDLCSSSNHAVGNELPIAQALELIVKNYHVNGGGEISEKDKSDTVWEMGAFNMILPVATTPLLMSLYTERGRLYHNGVNITGDVLALTPATGQWGKVFADVFMMDFEEKSHLSKKTVMVTVALESIVSYSYAIDYSVLAPAKSLVDALFSPDNVHVVIRRDTLSGLTCPLGVAMLTAYLPKEEITSAVQVGAWNTLLITIFSRLCEAISGQKVIRYSNGKADPSDLELPYRLLIGELQTNLKRRLHVEWANSSKEEKLSLIAANAVAVKNCLLKIANEYLNELGSYNLPTLSNATKLLNRAIAVKNYGIGRLRDHFLNGESIGDIIAELLNLQYNSFVLPVCGTSFDQSNMCLRELEDGDHELMMAFVDGIVATKVSPKIVYKPIVNPSYPTFSASENQGLRFKKDLSSWDVNLPVANVCLVGNVNCGKSSIGGKLLNHLNIVSDKTVKKMEDAAKKIGRSEVVQYAWVMDSLKEERAGGYTVVPKFNGFQTSTRRFTLIDNPGHNDYSVNYTRGVYHADIILLVVSAVASEQQLAEVSRSCAEEHLITAFCFGIRRVVVLVNKMDAVGYSEQAYLDTKAKAWKHLKKAGFKVDEESVCIPMSALEGDGLLSFSSNLSWFDGPCLLQALDYVSLPPRHDNKQFRMVIDQHFKISGVGTVLCGKVERGTLSVGDRINIYPSKHELVSVRSIESHGHSLPIAKPGDDIGLALASAIKDDTSFKGKLIGLSTDPPVPLMKCFEVQMLIVGKNTKLRVGQAPTITTHLYSIQVKIVRLVETVGKNNIVLKSNPDEVKSGDTCIVEMEARHAIAAETIHDCPKLSRFVIQSNRLTVAIGFVRSKLM